MAVVRERDQMGSTLSSASHVGDTVFGGLTRLFAIIVIVVAASLVLSLILQAWPALQHIGFSVVAGQNWDPTNASFGALSFIYGTLVTSLLALLLAGVVGVMIAVFLSELAPPVLSRPVSFLVEMLAAVPSIIYGLWGIFVLIPLLTPLENWLNTTLGPAIPLFGGTVSPTGSLFITSLILAIMILPTIAAISRDVMAAVPGSQREGMLALGATRWEVVSKVVIPYARAGIVGGLILGLGRAVGETMAAAMVIGYTPNFPSSLLAGGSSIATVLANDAGEAFSTPVWIGALFELGLLLFLISVTLNVIARLLVWSVNRGMSTSSR